MISDQLTSKDEVRPFGGYLPGPAPLPRLRCLEFLSRDVLRRREVFPTRTGATSVLRSAFFPAELQLDPAYVLMQSRPWNIHGTLWNIAPKTMQTRK